MNDDTSQKTGPHVISRVRHDIRRRQLTVQRIEQLTPGMRRIHFTAPDLDEFLSLGADDHVKLFLNGPDGETVTRDYTPRAFDTANRRLVIDFAIHEAGPATAWAIAAEEGSQLEIAGPRGSMVVPDDFDWYLLIADETGLPAVGRRLEELRADVPVMTVVLVDIPADRQDIATAARWTPIWLSRDSGSEGDFDMLRDAVAKLTLPDGDGYIWIAAEASVAKALRAHFLDHGHPIGWMRAAGYWQRGASGAHENF